MSDAEKVKLFEDRYRAAFKDMQIIASDLYYIYSPKYAEISDNYSNELHKYFDKGGGGADLKSDYPSNYKQAYYGDLTDEEIRAVIQEKYKGTGTMEDKYVMLSELSQCGLTKPGEFNLLSSIEMQIFKQVEDAHEFALRGTGLSISQHPRFLDMFMSYAKGVGKGSGYMPNWTQIVNAAKDNIGPGEHCSSKYLEEMREEMDDFLEEILGRG